MGSDAIALIFLKKLDSTDYVKRVFRFAFIQANTFFLKLNIF